MNRNLAGWLVPVLVLAVVLPVGSCRRSSAPGERSGRGARGAAPARTVEPTIATTSPEPAAVAPAERPVPRVAGEIYLRERIALPGDATVLVRAVRRDPGGPEVIASIKRAAPRHPPIPFELTCDPADVNGAAEIVLEAEIVRKGRIVFSTPAPVRVLEDGRPTVGVKLLLRRTG